MTDANLRIFHVAFRDREVAILVNPLQQGDPDTHRLFEVLYRETDLVELTGYRTLNEALTHAHFLEAWHGRDD
jgi:hypothetical protein